MDNLYHISERLSITFHQGGELQKHPENAPWRIRVDGEGGGHGSTGTLLCV